MFWRVWHLPSRFIPLGSPVQSRCSNLIWHAMHIAALEIRPPSTMTGSNRVFPHLILDCFWTLSVSAHRIEPHFHGRHPAQFSCHCNGHPNSLV
eukprot:57023-Rhodomonas_salina.1